MSQRGSTMKCWPYNFCYKQTIFSYVLKCVETYNNRRKTNYVESSESILLSVSKIFMLLALHMWNLNIAGLHTIPPPNSTKNYSIVAWSLYFYFYFCVSYTFTEIYIFLLSFIFIQMYFKTRIFVKIISFLGNEDIFLVWTVTLTHPRVGFI